ncbi:hypothetical protein D3C80_310620 [compost metagenome]
MNNLNACLLGFAWRSRLVGLTIQRHSAVVTLDNTTHYLDERRFTRTIFTHKAVNFTRCQFKIDTVQGNNAAEAFPNSFE